MNLIDDATFSRNSVARYVNSAGILREVLANKPRPLNYQNGIKGLLLEQELINLITFTEALDNAAWTANDVTIGADDYAAPDLAITADRMTEGSGTITPYVQHADITITANADIVYGFFCRQPPVNGQQFAYMELEESGGGRRTRIWKDLTDPNQIATQGTGITNNWAARLTRLANGWFWCQHSVNIGGGVTALTPRLGMSDTQNVVTYTGGGTDSVFAWGPHAYDNKAHYCSYVQNLDAGSFTQPVEIITWPITSVVQPFSLYVAMIEMGCVEFPTIARVVQISNTANDDPRLLLDNSNGGGVYRIFHDNGPSSVERSLAAAPSLNDMVELLAHFRSDGSVQLEQAIDGGTPTTTTQSAALEPAFNWSGGQIQLGQINGSSASAVHLQAVKAIQGIQTLAFCRGFQS